jgi:hypothetical protein
MSELQPSRPGPGKPPDAGKAKTRLARLIDGAEQAVATEERRFLVRLLADVFVPLLVLGVTLTIGHQIAWDYQARAQAFEAALAAAGRAETLMREQVRELPLHIDSLDAQLSLFDRAPGNVAVEAEYREVRRRVDGVCAAASNLATLYDWEVGLVVTACERCVVRLDAVTACVDARAKSTSSASCRKKLSGATACAELPGAVLHARPRTLAF